MPRRKFLIVLTATCSSALSFGVGSAQTVLPTVTLSDPIEKLKPSPAKTKAVVLKPERRVSSPAARPQRAHPAFRYIAPPSATPTGTAAAAPTTPSATPVTQGPQGEGAGEATGPVSPPVAAARSSEAQARAARERILAPAAANVTTISRDDLLRQPQGDQTPFDRALLQLPGVTQDTAGSGDFHIRNEHANVQYRINGIRLPDGVSGFSQVLDTSFIRTLSLVDGALPAEYGLRTAGLIDITTRNGADNPGSTVGIYGGQHDTILPTVTTSGVSGRWDYFFTGRFDTNQLGIENETPGHDAIHDRTRQGRYFAYASTPLDDGTRFTFMSGASITKYQIPNQPGVAPAFTAFGVSNFDSTALNENQLEHSLFNILALQKSIGPLDTQVSYFQRYSTLHFIPDQVGDLVFNGIASDVSRLSLVNGIQSDNAYRLTPRSTIRFGFTTEVERAEAINNSTVLPLDGDGNPVDAPFFLGSAQAKTGVLAGVYVSDEYKLTPTITITGGLRFDYAAQFVDADQLSPRLGAVWAATPTTSVHFGYSRYFTPPELALSFPTQLAAFNNTTAQPGVTTNDPVRPERSHVLDVGIDQQFTPSFSAGVDAYYKNATNLIDDGQFGQALVLTAFNYARAYNDGVEVKLRYVKDGFRAYGNMAVAQQKAEQVSSNQYLFDPGELAYIQNNYIPTDHDQLFTASAGASYRLGPAQVSLDAIYGSGLRNGFANLGTVPQYAVLNAGFTYDVTLAPGAKPATFRFAIVNLLDHPYEIRDGSGIGVFAPQYGQRRGFFGGLSQRF